MSSRETLATAGTARANHRERTNIALPDGELFLYPGLFPAAQCRELFATLRDATPWRQEEIRLGTKRYLQPRLTAWHGDPGASYSYSGVSLQPLPWTGTLSRIKVRVSAYAQCPFNSVLLNLYRDGGDSVGWHSDDEPELGRNPVIASVSLGATRKFVLRHKKRKDVRPVVLDLSDGDLVLMCRTTQHFRQHHVPKTAAAVGPRINLTFRFIYARDWRPTNAA